MQRTIIAGAIAVCLSLASARAGAAQTATGPLPSVLTIHIKNFTFEPKTANIHAGDRVTFVNDDDEAHTATSTDTSFDSTGLDSGQSWQHVFAKPGTYSYFCELHPYMKATIVVLRAGGGVQH